MNSSRRTYLEPNISTVASPSASASLGGEEFMSKICLDLTPRGQRLLFTPLHSHSVQIHSSWLKTWRPALAPAQPMWKPRSQPSQTTTWPLISGPPHAPQAPEERRAWLILPAPASFSAPGSSAGPPSGGGGLSWKFRTTSNESGRVSWSEGEGISLRSIPRPSPIPIPDRVSSAECLDSSLTLLSSSLESVSSIIRVSAPSSMSASHDVALVTLLASAFKIQIWSNPTAQIILRESFVFLFLGLVLVFLGLDGKTEMERVGFEQRVGFGFGFGVKNEKKSDYEGNRWKESVACEVRRFFF